jgi:hypothetical protein
VGLFLGVFRFLLPFFLLFLVAAFFRHHFVGDPCARVLFFVVFTLLRLCFCYLLVSRSLASIPRRDGRFWVPSSSTAPCASSLGASGVPIVSFEETFSLSGDLVLAIVI